MRFFAVSPEVPGELGDDTVINTSVHPPLVSKLHYELDAWLGDDLIKGFPCYLVTHRLKEKLEASSLNGFLFAPIKFTVSDNFKELHPSKAVPNFVWLKVSGRAGVDDFGVEMNGRLVVSERALKLIQDLSLNHCEICPR